MFTLKKKVDLKLQKAKFELVEKKGACIDHGLVIGLNNR